MSGRRRHARVLALLAALVLGAGAPAVGASDDASSTGPPGVRPVLEDPPPGTAYEPDQAAKAPTGPAPANSVPTARVAGADRYATAVAISRRQFGGGAPRVYLARGDVYADAIAAGSLTDGPVLLVPSCAGVPASVRAEVDRLAPGELVALGGTAAVCDRTLAEAADGRPTDRIAGSGRAATAAGIARHAFPGGAARVYLAESEQSADAVAGGSLTDGPVLLVPRGSGEVPPATLSAVTELGPDYVIALGGTAAVSPSALLTAAKGRSSWRISGADRYATAVAIANRQFPDGVGTAYLARGDSFADAVAGGILTDGPVLLVPSGCRELPESVWRYLGERRPQRVVALGGKGAVCSLSLTTAGRLSTFSGMEEGPRTRLLALITKSRAIDPVRYVPPDLVPFRGGQHRLRPEVATQLEALFDAAAAAGHPNLSVTSGFRSYETQQATYDYWVRLLGRERADQISARPGHSEHQLGLAADLAGPSCSGWECFGDTPEGRWVAANAHRFGFIIRYPEGGMPVTGYDYEPWHVRYVGPRASWMMTVRGQVYWERYQPTAVRDGNGF